MSQQYTEQHLVQLLRDWCDRESQKDVAAHLAISEQHMSDLVRGNRNISTAIARKLGYRRVIVFEVIPNEQQ